MNYTVNELAKLSGVSIRTLHHYDAIGLLKPAFIGENKYRYYNEEQLLLLQQILFFKELGLELKHIKSILDGNDFDTLRALRFHAKEVQQRIEQLSTLSKTVDKTIKHLEGKESMKEKELYHGFDNERQKKYEQELKEYFGKQGKAAEEALAKHTAQAKENVIRQHFQWLANFWTPDRESYKAHAQFIQNSELKKAYNKYDSKLSEFIAQAIALYADKL